MRMVCSIEYKLDFIQNKYKTNDQEIPRVMKYSSLIASKFAKKYHKEFRRHSKTIFGLFLAGDLNNSIYPIV